MKKEPIKGTLQGNEPHPAIESAKDYARTIPIEKLMAYLETFSSCAISGDRLSGICAETLRRLLQHKNMSDRYFLGLMWTIKALEELKEEIKNDE